MDNLLIITYWSFKDALIQTYTLPYVKLIRKHLHKDQKIYLVTLAQPRYKMKKDEWENEKSKWKKENIHLIRFNYSNFGFLMMLKFPFIFLSLVYLIITKKISHIHTWCTPAGAIGFVLSILIRKKLIIDSFEPHAEPMLESKTWEKDSLKFKLLFWLEKKQLQKAHKVITCVDSMPIYVKEKFDIELNNYYSKPACIDFSLFDVNKSKNQALIKKYDLKDKVVGLYAGKFEGSYLKDEVFELIKTAENYWGVNHFRFIILTSHSRLFVNELISKFNIDPNTIIQLFVPHHEVSEYMRLADFGISPFIPVPSKRYGSPIKNSEYFAMGLPIIITKGISDDSDAVQNNGFGYVLQELNDAEYQNACKKIAELICDTSLSKKIHEFALSTRNIEIANKVYQDIYSTESILSPTKPKNILILTYWSYKDALIQTYTLPYVNIIRDNLNPNDHIYLFTLEQPFHKMTKEEWENESLKLSKKNIHLIRFGYSHFGLKMIFKISLLLAFFYKLILSKNISTIHAWCTPAGAIGYILSKLTNADLIIDSYEPHAESMVENGTWSKNSLKFKLLFWLEKKQSQQATAIIALTEGMKTYAKEKYNAQFEHYFVKPALVNLNLFNWHEDIYLNSRKEKGFADKIVCIYTGKLGGIYLHDEFFDFIKVAQDYWLDRFHLLLLTNTHPNDVDVIINKKNISKNNINTLYVNHTEVQNYLQIADFAINFVKPVPSKKYCTSIKDSEYWAMGLPIVITNGISDDSDLIKNNQIGSVLEGLNNISYLKSVKEIDALLKEKNRVEWHKTIRPFAENYRNFNQAKEIYASIYGKPTL